MVAVFDVILDSLQERMRSATPVVVQTWTEPDGAGAHADVQLTIPDRAPNGAAIEPTPIVAERPVFYPAGGGWTVHYPLASGDQVLGLTIDRNTEGWNTNRTPGAPAHTLVERLHDVSDLVVVAMADRPALPSPATGLDTDFVITHETGGVIIRAGTDGLVTITASANASITVNPNGQIDVTGTTVKVGDSSAEALVKLNKLIANMTTALNAGVATPPTPMAGNNGSLAMTQFQIAWNAANGSNPMGTTKALGT
jgi:hypothetical protein